MRVDVLKELLFGFLLGILTVGAVVAAIYLLDGCSHPNTVHADRVFVDDGHTYRAYRNDREGIIVHDGGCQNPIHFCEERKTP